MPSQASGVAALAWPSMTIRGLMLMSHGLSQTWAWRQKLMTRLAAGSPPRMM